ncbi:integrase [Burkholderia pseudomallei]|nr:integrase [Burkholderia pseudomallei]
MSDFTYVSTWQGGLCVAFAIDVLARRIVGGRVSWRRNPSNRQRWNGRSGITLIG